MKSNDKCPSCGSTETETVYENVVEYGQKAGERPVITSNIVTIVSKATLVFVFSPPVLFFCVVY